MKLRIIAVVGQHREMQPIKELWQRHCDAEFPSACYGLELSGIDFVTLDTTIAGIVSSFIDQAQTLNSQQREILNRCRQALGDALPTIDDDGREYFNRLKTLADLVQNTP